MALGAWVDCSARTGALFGYAADMGPYIGPWPPEAPGVIDGVSGGIVEFDLVYPNPASPDDPTLVGDGSYDTVDIYTYRYTDTNSVGSTASYGNNWYGAAAPWDGSAQPGIHLYVSVDNGGVLPAQPPSYYVPNTYSALGLAAFETTGGHWSTVQSGYAVDETVTPGTAPTGTPPSQHATNHSATTTAGGVGHPGGSPGAGDANVTTTAQTSLAADLAATPTSTAVGGFEVFAAKNQGDATISNWQANTTASVSIAQDVKHYAAAATYPDYQTPPALSSMEYGVAWGPGPDPTNPGEYGNGFQYDGLSFTGITWSGVTMSVRTQQFSIQPVTGGTPTDLAAGAATVLAILNPTAASSGWISGGTTLYSAAFSPSGVGYDVTTSVPLSVSGFAFTLGLTTDAVVSGAISGAEAPNFAMPAYNGPYAGYDYRITPVPPVSTVAHKVTDSWRYWVPGQITPTTPTEVPYLRMSQRDDGFGIARHARLNVAATSGNNQATSYQYSRAPRVGYTNRYT